MNKKGFTLIEMLVVISLIGLIAVTASGFLIVSLMSSAKANVTKEIRQTGNYALSVMEGLILTSTSVGCTSPNYVHVKDINGNLATFECRDGGSISSSSATITTPVNLISTNVTVSGCNFNCSTQPGLPTKVHLEYTLNKGDANSRPSERASVTFETEVLNKNLD